ncbi:Cytohesin-4 [Balamuthia mandrillaris]
MATQKTSPPAASSASSSAQVSLTRRSRQFWEQDVRRQSGGGPLPFSLSEDLPSDLPTKDLKRFWEQKVAEASSREGSIGREEGRGSMILPMARDRSASIDATPFKYPSAITPRGTYEPIFRPRRTPVLEAFQPLTPRAEEETATYFRKVEDGRNSNPRDDTSSNNAQGLKNEEQKGNTEVINTTVAKVHETTTRKHVSEQNEVRGRPRSAVLSSSPTVPTTSPLSSSASSASSSEVKEDISAARKRAALLLSPRGDGLELLEDKNESQESAYGKNMERRGSNAQQKAIQLKALRSLAHQSIPTEMLQFKVSSRRERLSMMKDRSQSDAGPTTDLSRILMEEAMKKGETNGSNNTPKTRTQSHLSLEAVQRVGVQWSSGEDEQGSSSSSSSLSSSSSSSSIASAHRQQKRHYHRRRRAKLEKNEEDGKEERTEENHKKEMSGEATDKAGAESSQNVWKEESKAGKEEQKMPSSRSRSRSSFDMGTLRRPPKQAPKEKVVTMALDDDVLSKQRRPFLVEEGTETEQTEDGKYEGEAEEEQETEEWDDAKSSSTSSSIRRRRGSKGGSFVRRDGTGRRLSVGPTEEDSHVSMTSGTTIASTASPATKDGGDVSSAPSSGRNSVRIKESAKESILREGIRLFNDSKHPMEGIEYLMEQGVVGKAPTDIARFLHNNKALNKSQLGILFGEGEEMAGKILDAYIKQMDFALYDFDVALRKLLLTFKLPGEAQRIDRIMKCWAGHYFVQNPDVFPQQKCAYVLAYATIMLNTDAHHMGVRYKMTKQQFLTNTIQNDGGELISVDLLEDLYSRIVEEEVRMIEEEEDKKEEKNNKKKKDKEKEKEKQNGPLFPDAMRKGWMNVRNNKQRFGKWKRRWVILTKNKAHVMKKIGEEVPLYSIPLRGLLVSWKHPNNNNSNKEKEKDKDKKYLILLHHYQDGSSAIQLSSASSASSSSSSSSKDERLKTRSKEKKDNNSNGSNENNNNVLPPLIGVKERTTTFLDVGSAKAFDLWLAAINKNVNRSNRLKRVTTMYF